MSLQNKFEFIVFSVFTHIFRLIGIKRARYAARFLALLFFYIIPVRKKVAFNNISNAFPEFTPNQINKTAFESYLSFAITIAEMACFPSMKKEDFFDIIDYSGIEIITEAYAENRGLLLLTAHFGNWEIGAAGVGVKLGIPLHVIVKEQRNGMVTTWINKTRETFGNKVIPLGLSIKNVYQALSRKNIIGVVGDQRGPRDGIKVKFFNHDTCTYPGTAAMALKTNAPVITTLLIRQPDYSYKLQVERIDLCGLTGTQEEKIGQINQKYFAILENAIRKNPGQWLWMHKIWKY